MTKILPHIGPPSGDDSPPWPYRSYTEIFRDRLDKYQKILANPVLQKGAREYYKDKPAEFIQDWLTTYDPRNSGKPHLPTTMPFILFPKQIELVDYLKSCLEDGESGLIEKSRDMGATWVCCGFTVWLFLFWEGVSVGWGSRKEQLVDKIGDPDSIFEKIRVMLRMVPKFFLPDGFNLDRHSSYMKIVNPVSGATITGEAGDNIGRGGRKSIYFKDESAHYERPEKIEAALGDNTDVQIDFSSVNGPGNIFYRRRQNGIVWKKGLDIPTGTVRVFIFDWRDHPLKTQEWYDSRRDKAEREGLLNIFLQEVDRDYTSAVEGTLIPGPWVQAALDLKKKFFPSEDSTGLVFAALDPYDEGGDAHAITIRKGPEIKFLSQWFKGDTGDATRKAILYCRMYKVNEFQFDSIGVGAGVKAETNRLRDIHKLPWELEVSPWTASAKVKDPKKPMLEDDQKSIKNQDFYKNLKSQAFWQLRLRFERTYKFVNKGENFDYSELISIPSDLKDVHQFMNELSQITYKPNDSGKIIINKKPPGTKSPNMAESGAMAFWPAPKKIKQNTVGAPLTVKP